MVKIVQGFNLTAKEAIDSRLILSKEQMLKTRDAQMPEKYFAVCTDDGYLYIYDKSNEKDEVTGKFRVYSAGSKIESITVNGVEIPIGADKSVDLPLATAERHGLVMPSSKGFSFGENGELVIDFNSIDDYSIPYTKINFEGSIIDGNDNL